MPAPATSPSTHEPFTWLQPGAWRQPSIVHVTMVANARRPLFGTLTHDGKEAQVEKTPIGWAVIREQQGGNDMGKNANRRKK